MGQCQSCISGADCPSATGLGLPPNFKVLRELGFGNEGKTYLVQERTPQGTQLFACKAIPRGRLLHPDFVLQGLRNQSSLCFVHVVKFLEVLLTGTYLIIKFEYVGGGDLFRYVCRQHFISQSQLMDEEHARFLFIQILFALHHCHEHRVAHRDVKFANLLCTRSRNPIIKICDFGLSKAWEHQKDATSFSAVGTLMFMSPEVVRARASSSIQKPYDLCKSDVWGLGIMLYTMLFGRFPFTNTGSRSAESNTSRAQLVTGSTSTFSFLLRRMEMAHRTDPQRLNEEISRSELSVGIKKLLLSMLAIDENLRISLDELVEHPWVRVGLSLPRARAIATVRWGREAGKSNIPYVHGELVPGSPADQELEKIVRRAARLGGKDDELVRWLPPGVRLKAEMTESERSALEEQGIRQCSKCREDPEDKYNALLAGIKIMPH